VVERSYRRIAAVGKTCAILKFLGNSKEPISAVGIANTVGLAFGTTCCHLSTLEDFGFVQKIGDRYQIGLGLVLIKSRLKANLEGQRMLIDANLKELEEGTNG
jgi:DNA-binding IclR family transcriptional regulator